MPNRGVAPPDLTSDVGQFRVLVGDTNYEPLTPPEAGFGDYEKFSDAEIEGYLLQGEGSTPRAIGYAYLYLAGQAAIASQSVKDYDLAVDTTKRADSLLAIANMWFGKADAEGSEHFEIVPVGPRGQRRCPEATQRPVRCFY